MKLCAPIPASRNFDAEGPGIYLVNIAEEVKEVAAGQAELWDIFQSVPNKYRQTSLRGDPP